jgi:hypothetical protein
MTSALLPDFKAAMIDYLESSLALRPEPYTDNVLITWDMPAERPNRVILIRGDGGLTRSVKHVSARFGLQIWAETDEVANDLGNMVHMLLNSCRNNGPFRGPNYLSVPQDVVDRAGARTHGLRYIATEIIVVGA